MSNSSDRGSADVFALMAIALARGASDLHLKAGRPPILRIDGRIVYTETDILSADDVAAMARQIMDDRVYGRFLEAGAVDFSTVLPGGDRFRVNVYRQRGHTSLAARRVLRRVGSFMELHLPVETMERIANSPKGLVVFAGVTGTGKSTSIAACIQYINERRPCHIITLEDPIEFLFEDQEAFIDQREIGSDVATFEDGLRSVLREDPDVVFVGEVRDTEGVTSVLRAAETTRLVFTTVHAPSAPGVITRILDLFPPQDLRIVREALAANLVAVVCQKLVACEDPNMARVPATEVLLNTAPVAAAIREGTEADLPAIIATAAGTGMHDFTQDLARLVREEWIDPKTAYEAAPNPEALKMAIRGIQFKKGTLK